MKHQHEPVPDRERSAQFTMDASSIRVPKRSLLDRLSGKPGKTVSVPLTSICDYEEIGDPETGRRLVLYVFNTQSSVAEWQKIRRLSPIDTTAMNKKAYRKLIDRISEMALTNQQLGVIKQSWYYTSMTVSLDFG